MARINAQNQDYRDLNNLIRSCGEDTIELDGVMGQRFIACGMSGKHFRINGVPGNAMGAYLNGSDIEVFENAQDAVGDTMNDGKIIIHGSVGDACGYAMRGGKIYIRESAGYRAGIHMKAYKDKQPLIIIGDAVGSFLGEYQAGGTIIVLGLRQNGRPPVGYFCGTGMHGGKIYLRSDYPPFDLPPQVSCREAGEKDLTDIKEKIGEFCTVFGIDKDAVMRQHFLVLEPNSANPYKQLYTNI